MKAIAFLFGAGLVAVGRAIWFSGGIALPTSSPPRQFHFSGLSLFLLAGLPAALGLTVLAPARGALDREARTTQVAIVLGIAMLGLAFARSTKF